MMDSAAVTGSELRDLYRELILDHARQPRHFGSLADATHGAAGINPLCGDKLQLHLKLGASGQIADIRFEGSGCAISVASASLMAEAVNGLHSEDALALFAAFNAQLTTDIPASDNNLGKLGAFQGVKEFPSRVKCATLAWHALRSALAGDQQIATTE